jgi:hypothetical protein
MVSTYNPGKRWKALWKRLRRSRARIKIGGRWWLSCSRAAKNLQVHASTLSHKWCSPELGCPYLPKRRCPETCRVPAEGDWLALYFLEKDINRINKNRARLGTEPEEPGFVTFARAAKMVGCDQSHLCRILAKGESDVAVSLREKQQIVYVDTACGRRRRVLLREEDVKELARIQASRPGAEGWPTIREVADYLGEDIKRVRNYCNRNKLEMRREQRRHPGERDGEPLWQTRECCLVNPANVEAMRIALGARVTSRTVPRWLKGHAARSATGTQPGAESRTAPDAAWREPLPQQPYPVYILQPPGQPVPVALTTSPQDSATAEERNPGGRPGSEHHEAVKEYCYQQYIAGVKLALIRETARRLYGDEAAPKQDGHVTTYAQRWAEDNGLPRPTRPA